MTTVDRKETWSSLAPKVVYFGSVVCLIVLVNTPLPRVVLGSLLGAGAGDAFAVSLQGITRDLFVLLLVSIYFEFARGRSVDRKLSEALGQLGELRTSVDLLGATGLEAAIRERVSPQRVLELGFEMSLQGERGAADLARLVDSSISPVETMSAVVRVESVTDGRVFLLSEERYRLRLNDPVVLVCEEPTVHAALSARISGILQTFLVASLGEVASDSTEFKSDTSHFILSSRSGSEDFQVVRFSELKDDELDQAISLPTGVTRKDVRAFQASLPALEGPREFRSELRHSIPSSGGYCFWGADRPTYLSRVEIDLAALKGHAEKVRFQVNLPRVGDIALARSSHRLTLLPSCWVLPGHGVTGMWFNPKEEQVQV